MEFLKKNKRISITLLIVGAFFLLVHFSGFKGITIDFIFDDEQQDEYRRLEPSQKEEKRIEI